MVKNMQNDITIFAKPAFLDVDPSRPFKYEGKPPKRGWLKRISSITRGEQIAEYIGAKLNPTEGYQNDICIYVKPPYKEGHDFLFEGKKAYLDILDAPGFHDLLKKHLEVTVISTSDSSYKILKRVLPNNIINIPEQHCNFERVRRSRKQITKVGCIGNPKVFNFLPPGLKEALAERKIELIEFSQVFTRQDVVNFYLNIDVQIIWRPYLDQRKDISMNPLKIINASSFGIPTIMYDEKCAQEMEGCYIPVHTLDEFLIELDKLRSDPKLYEEYAKRCIEKSEEYHIEKIGELYKNLALEDSTQTPVTNKVSRRNSKRGPWYSTYEENNFGDFFYSLMRLYQPERVIELGTKGGFSAYHMARGLKANGKGRLFCYDRWDHIDFYHLTQNNLKEFGDTVYLEMRDAIGIDKIYDWVDVLHIDLGNEGRTLEKVLPFWIDKARLIIIEGGSDERDNRGWMIKNKAGPIRKWLEDFSRRRGDIEYFTLDPFPSLTLVRKK